MAEHGSILRNDFALDINRIYDYFGIEGDPFDFLLDDTEDIRACTAALNKSIARHLILVITGDVGAGKTTWVALQEIRRDLCFISVDKENCRSVSPQTILKHLIRGARRDMKAEAVPRDPHAQVLEAKRVLEERWLAGEQVVLCLDDGQQFQPEALRSLKRIREFRLGTRRNLVAGVVYLTHTSGRIQIKQLEEIGRRITLHNMTGLTNSELREFIARSVGGFFASPEPIELFVRECWDRRPLVVRNQLDMLLHHAMCRGSATVELCDVKASVSLNSIVKHHDISLAEIQERTGLSKAVVSQITRGTYKGSSRTTEKVRDVVNTLVALRTTHQVPATGVSS